MKRLWCEMSEAELLLYGCVAWDRRRFGKGEIVHYLIPERYYHELDQGDELVSITGKKVRVGPDYKTPGTEGYIDSDTRYVYIDSDTRYGMLGYGVLISKVHDN